MCIKSKYRKPFSKQTANKFNKSNRQNNIIIESFAVCLEQHQFLYQFDDYIENRLYDCGYDFSKNYSYFEYIIPIRCYKFYIRVVKPIYLFNLKTFTKYKKNLSNNVENSNSIIIEFLFHVDNGFNHNDNIFQVDLLNNIISNVIHSNIIYKFININNSSNYINPNSDFDDLNEFDDPLFDNKVKYLY